MPHVSPVSGIPVDCNEVPVGTVSELVLKLHVPRQQVTRARLDGA